MLASSPVVDAAIINLDFNGLFTMLNSDGEPYLNTSHPYSYDPTWGYGVRTPISGTISMNTETGVGTGTINPFEFYDMGFAVFHDMTIQWIGDGMGGNGSLFVANMLMDVGGLNSVAISVDISLVWDFNGALTVMQPWPYEGQSISGVGALPATNDIVISDYFGTYSYPIGPAPVATTTWNTDGSSWFIVDDGIGGSPMMSGPYYGFSVNIDITDMTVTSVVPVPAAVWLFGSGLLALVGFLRVQKIMILNK